MKGKKQAMQISVGKDSQQKKVSKQEHRGDIPRKAL